MSLESTNPLETDDGKYPVRPKTTAFPGGLPPEMVDIGGGGEAIAADRLELAVEIGGEPALNRSFLPSEVLVGRRPSNDITIDGEGLKVVSGHHMRFAFEGGHWCVEDKGSTNGTFLNGVRVAGLQAIRHGDVVELGRPRKVGSYRSVKLSVSLPSRPAVDVTGTSDAVGSEETLVPGLELTQSEFAEPSTDDDVDASAVPEAILQTMAAVPPPVEPAPDEAPVAADPVPASKPEDLRALIEKVQEKSRRLGEVSYRLDAHVMDLASAIVERHGALGLADVDGGTAVVDRLDERESKRSRLAALETERPLAQARYGSELEPLEAEEKERMAAAEALSTRLEEASTQRTATAAALDEQLGALTASLRESLGPVVDAVVADGLPKPATGSSVEPVWQHWAEALASSAEEIKGREAELDAARDAAAKASSHADSVEAESKLATEAWEEAKGLAGESRASGERALAEMDTELTEAKTRLDSLEDEIGAAAKEFVLGLLSGADEPAPKLAALAGMDEARAFASEAEVLRAELADLERHGA